MSAGSHVLQPTNQRLAERASLASPKGLFVAVSTAAALLSVASTGWAELAPFEVRVESRGCLEDSTFYAALLRHLERPQDIDGLVLRVVEREHGQAHLEVLESGRVVAERDLTGLAGPCDTQTDAVALAASIAIDALLRERAALSESPSDSAPKKAGQSEPITARSERPAPEPRGNLSFFAGAGVGAQAAGLAPRAELGVAWSPQPLLLLNGRFLVEAQPQSALGAGSMSWQRFGVSGGVGLRFFHEKPLHLDLLLEPVLVLQIVRGHGFAEPLTQQSLEPGLSASIRVGGSSTIAPWLELGLTGWARQQLARAVAPADTRQIGRVQLRLAIGISCCAG